MLPEALREARDWLIRAERDLLIAERAISLEPYLSDQAAYHAQQAAEKSLKGFLAAHNAVIPKTHNLEYLVTLCEPLDATMIRFVAAARILSPFAALFRYPGGPLEPALDDARDAIRLAGELQGYVWEQIFGSRP